MKKNDIILLTVLAVTALISYIGVKWYGEWKTKDPQAVVTVEGREYGIYPLTKEGTVNIELADGSYNILVIEKGMADIADASCPDKVCVRHKPIDKNGETLVCLPNKVVVEIKNAAESGVDASTY